MATDPKSGEVIEEVKVEFDAAQQARVNDLIQDAMGRAGGDARREAAAAKALLATATSELEAAKVALAKAKPAQKVEGQADVDRLAGEIAELRNIHQSQSQEMERLKLIAQEKEKEVQTVKLQSLNSRKESELKAAANKLNVHDVDMVVDATKANVVWDEQKSSWSVIDPRTGQPRLNSGLYPMSVDEYYAEFISTKPWMARGTVKPGAGGAEGTRFDISNNGKYTVDQIFGKGSDSKLANDLAMKDYPEYKRLKQIAIDSGRVAGQRSK